MNHIPSQLDSQDPDLLQRIKVEYLDRTIAGEDKNKLLLFLVCLSASTKRPLSTVVKGSPARASHGSSTESWTRSEKWAR